MQSFGDLLHLGRDYRGGNRLGVDGLFEDNGGIIEGILPLQAEELYTRG